MKEKEKIEKNNEKRMELQLKRANLPVFEFVPVDVSELEEERKKAIAETVGVASLEERAAIINKFSESIIELKLADSERHRTEMEEYAKMVDAHQAWIDAELIAMDADDDLLHHTIKQKINESLDFEVQSYANTETPAQDNSKLIDHKLLTGFGKSSQKKLADAGITTWSNLAQLTVEEVNGIIDSSSSVNSVQEWIDFAKSRLA